MGYNGYHNVSIESERSSGVAGRGARPSRLRYSRPCKSPRRQGSHGDGAACGGPVRRSCLCSEGGFTLVELLVAAALTVIMVLIVLEIFRSATELSERSGQREELLVNATNFFSQMSDMLANCEAVGTAADPQEGVATPVFFMERRVEDGVRFDSIAFNTRAAERTVDELTGRETGGAQNVFVYVTSANNPSLRELVVHRFGTNDVPAGVDDLVEAATPDERRNISVLCRFVTEFRVEYLDISARETEEDTGVRLEPLVAGEGAEGRSYKAAGADLQADRGMTRWHTPATENDGRSLHDKYDGMEMTTPRALRFTIELRARDSDLRQRFHFVIRVKSPNVTITAAAPG